MKNEDTLERGVSDGHAAAQEDEGPSVGFLELLTWIGQAKRPIALFTAGVAIAALAVAFLLPPVYTATATMLPPASQQQSGSAAALAALGALGGLAGAGGFGAKTPDELYVALLKSDSVVRGLDERFGLRKRYEADTYETLRKVMPRYVRVGSDKKSGLISVEVEDEDAKFAAELANAHLAEVTKVLGRLAVSEAQLRRMFYEKQLNETKENLVKAEQAMRRVQEKSGVIVLDKQAEALITGAAQVRALIAEREVQLKVLRTSATEQNPDVMRLNSELRALRAELQRMESSGGTPGSAIDLPVGKLPEAGIEYIRARRELKLQETLLESMLRQYEIAKLDEAKEGQTLQAVDVAHPPDRRSRPKRGLIVLGSTLAALIVSMAVAVVRRYGALARELDPDSARAWHALAGAWRWRRGG